MNLKCINHLPVLILVLLGLLACDPGQPADDTPVTGLPWQIERLPGGVTRVFDITLGETTLGEVIERVGDDDMDLAIIAPPQEDGSLEAYFSHYSAGPITGKLILVLDVEPAALASMRQQAFQDRGTRRYHLHPDDLPLARQATVRVITFLPGTSLDEEIIIARFGAPAEIIRANEQQQHYLYPDKGLDVVLNAKGKEVLQYLLPGEFSSYREQITP